MILLQSASQRNDHSTAGFMEDSALSGSFSPVQGKRLVGSKSEIIFTYVEMLWLCCIAVVKHECSCEA